MNKKTPWPTHVIKATLGCDEETALRVCNVLAGPMRDDATRYFLTKHLKMSVSIVDDGAGRRRTSDREGWIHEGMRRTGLFMVACAQNVTRPDLFANYTNPEEPEEPETPKE